MRSTTPEELITISTDEKSAVLQSSNTTDGVLQEQFVTENPIEIDDEDEDDDIATLLNDIDLSNLKTEIDYSDIDDDLN